MAYDAAKSRAWRLANPEKVKENKRKDWAKNNAKRREHSRKRREKNREHINELARARRAAAGPEKRNAKNAVYYKKHKNKVIARNKAYREENKEVVKERKRKWREKNKEKIRTGRMELYKKYRQQHAEKRAQIKYDVFAHYSGGTVKCAECDISDIDMLTLDHVDGGGCKHRKQVGAGTRMYMWLKNLGYPVGFQVLCWNHNMKKEAVRRRNKDLLVGGKHA
jgi:hypothetical protein